MSTRRLRRGAGVNIAGRCGLSERSTLGSKEGTGVDDLEGRDTWSSEIETGAGRVVRALEQGGSGDEKAGATLGRPGLCALVTLKH